MCANMARCPEGLRDCGIIEDRLEICLLFSAIVHDYEHPGLTNDFLVNTHHPYAQMHNDKSPLENHHASAGFQAIHKYMGNRDGQDHKVGSLHPIAAWGFALVLIAVRSSRTYMKST